MKLTNRSLWTFGLFAALSVSSANALTLVSSTPADGASDVSTTSPVSFTFDVEFVYSPAMFMNSFGITPAIQWSPALSFSYSVTPDQMTVICTPTAPLPANTTITWTLSPPNATMGFMDYEANELPTTTGSFTTAGSGQQTNSDNLTFCSVTKVVGGRQTNAATVIPYASNTTVYASTVKWAASDPVTAASLKFPGGAQHTLMSAFGLSEFFDTIAYDNQAQLDAALPSGTYTLSLQRQSGPVTVTMNVTDATGYPPTPKINNFDAAQSIDAGKSFTFTWTPMPNPQPQDSVHFYIDKLDSTEIFAAPNSTNALANTAGSITIPAGLLTPGETYDGILCFTRIVYLSTNTTTHVASAFPLTRSTYFTIHAGGGQPLTAPRFVNYGLDGSGQMSMSISADAGRTLIIEACSDLAGWGAVYTTQVPVGGIVSYKANPIGTGMFYRARVQ